MAFNVEYDMNRDEGIYFNESHPVTIGRWYLLEKPAVGIDGVSVSTNDSLNWEKHLGHFVQVIGYELPLQTDHCGLAKLYCKQCKKAFESISTQFLKEINR